MLPTGAMARAAAGDTSNTETVTEPGRIAGLLNASV